ncbi:hypothetical protein [Allocoleopsis franciscana]|nr:hypothetical protein [Allocoleopsis franciscana]
MGSNFTIVTQGKPSPATAIPRDTCYLGSDRLSRKDVRGLV